MKKELHDIRTEDDIKTLVDSFYDRVNQDELLSHIFNDFAHINWDEHLPVMYRFWSTVLFGSMAYKGQPFSKHLALPITAAHFTRWINLFHQTVDEHFSGKMAEEAKNKATGIASMFQYKMKSQLPII